MQRIWLVIHILGSFLVRHEIAVSFTVALSADRSSPTAMQCRGGDALYVVNVVVRLLSLAVQFAFSPGSLYCASLKRHTPSILLINGLFRSGLMGWSLVTCIGP